MARDSKPFDLVRLFAALADPTRLRLLNLMSGREVCVCYFVEILKEEQPKISRHLAYLRNAGIVIARREGKWMHYSIQRPDDERASSILDATLESFKTDREMQADLSRLDRACCAPGKIITRWRVHLSLNLYLHEGNFNHVVVHADNLLRCRTWSN